MSGSSKRSPASEPPARILPAALLLIALGASAGAFVYAQGWTLWFGDAEAHLNIARRILDSRTPGFEQTGTVWLPLPHWLMLPLAANLTLWRTGLAGTFVSCAAFVVAGCFLFAALRRALASRAAAWAGLLVFALNPNLLYLQSTPMTEPLVLACWMGLLYFLVRFRDSRGWPSLLGASVTACLGTLTRYEGWFLLPFAALWILASGGERRWRAAIFFCVVAGAGPLAWIAHNAYYYSNPLEFYNGPYSAISIAQRGAVAHPGHHDWRQAVIQFGAAAKMVLGALLFWLAGAGAVALALKRQVGMLILLAAAPFFYVLSVHSGGTPIFVPHLEPRTYYNTRYALSALPLAACGVAALAALMPRRVRPLAGGVLVLAAVSVWLAFPRAESWICWKESQVNSETRRAWTARAAAYLDRNYVRGEGIFTSFGDLIGIYRTAGIPLRETLHEGNGPAWLGARTRPDLMLFEGWAVCQQGDDACRALARARRWRLMEWITEKGAPPVLIWRSP